MARIRTIGSQAIESFATPRRAEGRATRDRGLWRVAIVHENRVAVRVTATTSGDDSFEVRRTLADLPGSDNVVVQAWGSGGIGCRAAATLPDSSS